VPDRGKEQTDRGSARPAQETIRRFRDDEGHLWTVREVVLDYDRRGRATLVFSNEDTLTMRRVLGFPSDWRTMADAELEALSHRR